MYRSAPLSQDRSDEAFPEWDWTAPTTTRRAGEPVPQGRVAVRAMRPRRAFRRRIILSLLVGDSLALTGAVGLAYLARMLSSHLGDPSNLIESLASSSVFIAVGWIVSLALFGGYSTRLLHVGPEMYWAVVWATLAATGFLGTALYLTGIDLSRVLFAVLFPAGVVALLLVRFFLRRAVHRKHTEGRDCHRTLIIGRGRDLIPIILTLRRESWLGYELVGAIVTDAPEQTWVFDDVDHVGPLEHLASVIDATNPSALLFAPGATAGAEQFRAIGWSLEHRRLDIVVIPAVHEIARDRVRMSLNAGLPFMHLDSPRAFDALQFTKRAIDIIGAATALALLSPLLAVVGAFVRFHDGGPALFRQERVGLRGTPFEILKFRTMSTDAEQRRDSVGAGGSRRGNGVLFKLANDPRTTRLGRFLRRYSIDELPQLWNVLRGDMSLVGPRPALECEVQEYDGFARRRLDVRPGMTGLWQVSGRSDLSWEDTVRLDLYYVDNWSLPRDLWILLRTVRAVLSPVGAY